MKISKRFCIEFAIILMVIASLASYFTRDNVILSLTATFAFIALLIIAIVNPLLLSKPARGWLKLGKGIAFVMNPIVLFMLYFGFMFPYSIILKLRSRRPIDVTIDKNKNSYWLDVSKAPKTDLTKQY